MYYLIYISTAIDGVDEEELHDILEKSVRNNELHGITGLLIFNSGMFIQMLEGNREAVHMIYDKIKADDRHTKISTLMNGESDKRFFPNWRMALKVTFEKTFRQMEAYESLGEGSDFLNGIKDEHVGIRLLRYFYESTKN